MNGSVSPLYEPALLLKQVGVVPGHDMTTEAALAKLSYLLALPDLSVKDVTRQMSISLRGELTEHTSVAFEHPGGQLPQHLSNLSALAYAIAKGDLLELNDVLKGDLDWLLNEADYSGNTPLVCDIDRD
jgi:60kDa lysophospholipase